MREFHVGANRQDAPFTVNGKSYVGSVTLLLDPSQPVTVEAPAVWEGEPGYRHKFFHLEAESLTQGWQAPITTPKVSFPNVVDIRGVFVLFHTYVKIDLLTTGPGTILRSSEDDGEGYYQQGSQIDAEAIPEEGAIFLRWTGGRFHGVPFSYIRIPGYHPETIVANFARPTGPRPTIVVEGALPTLRYRGEPEVMEGTVRVTALNGIVEFERINMVTVCGTNRTVISAVATGTIPPFDLTVGVVRFMADEIPDGIYSCNIPLIRMDGVPPTEVPVKLQLGPAPPEPGNSRVAAAVDAASYKAIPLAPGSIFSLFGERLADEAAAAPSLPLPQILRGTEVRLTMGNQLRTAPLFYVSPTQVNFLVPLDLPNGGGFLEVLRDGLASPPFSITAEPLAPALFTANSDGKGVPAGYYIRAKGDQQIRGELYTCPQGAPCTPLVIDSTDPAEDVYLILFGTGFRNFADVKPEVRIGSTVAEVTYFGAHNDFAGLDQINVKVPRIVLGTGAQNIVVRHVGKQANTVSVHF